VFFQKKFFKRSFSKEVFQKKFFKKSFSKRVFQKEFFKMPVLEANPPVGLSLTTGILKNSF